MTLKDELRRQGDWLFRWRSYIPIIVLPILLIALRHSEALERMVGNGANAAWEAFCLVVALSGLGLRFFTAGFVPAGTSGRNTTRQQAAALNTTGMYSVVRHPLYLGNFLVMLGIAAFIQVWWFILICSSAFWLYYERIMYAEEAFLERKFGDEFREWAARTPTFWPRRRNWRPSPLPFSWRTAARREFHGFFLITTAFPLLDALGDRLGEGHWEVDAIWVIAFALGLVTYVTMVALKRRSQLLDVPGR